MEITQNSGIISITYEIQLSDLAEEIAISLCNDDIIELILSINESLENQDFTDTLIDLLKEKGE
jgi:hypothetical protein